MTLQSGWSDFCNGNPYESESNQSKIAIEGSEAITT